MLGEARRGSLLAVARQAIEAQTRGRPLPTVDDPLPGPEASGVFVTIKRRGELRGCLGTLQCRLPLADEVVRCACDSASEDPRFPPITPDELPELSLEISVLGPLEEIDPGREGAIEVGRHGLVVEAGVRRGLLLPQVAIEWGWSVEQFLRQTCRKAGLPEEAWREGATVFRFEAEVFGD